MALMHRGPRTEHDSAIETVSSSECWPYTLPRSLRRAVIRVALYIGQSGPGPSATISTHREYVRHLLALRYQTLLEDRAAGAKTSRR